MLRILVMIVQQIKSQSRSLVLVNKSPFLALFTLHEGFSPLSLVCVLITAGSEIRPYLSASLALEKQPTDLRPKTCYSGDSTLMPTKLSFTTHPGVASNAPPVA
jgi:hypothetical protein